MSHNWLQAFRKQLGIPGLHLSTDPVDSCQHKRRGVSWCYRCSDLYRAKHRA